MGLGRSGGAEPRPYEGTVAIRNQRAFYFACRGVRRAEVVPPYGKTLFLLRRAGPVCPAFAGGALLRKGGAGCVVAPSSVTAFGRDTFSPRRRRALRGTRGGADRGVRPYGRLSIPGFIHPGLAVVGTLWRDT